MLAIVRSSLLLGGPVLIRLDHVTHHYGIRPVLREVSFEIRTGEVVCFFRATFFPATTEFT